MIEDFEESCVIVYGDGCMVLKYQEFEYSVIQNAANNVDYIRILHQSFLTTHEPAASSRPHTGMRVGHKWGIFSDYIYCRYHLLDRDHQRV